MHSPSNFSESDRIRKLKDRVRFTDYVINQTTYIQGCHPYPRPIESGSGSSNEASVMYDIRNGALLVTPQQLSTIIAENSCPATLATAAAAVTQNGSISFNGTTSDLLYSGITVGANAFTFEGWFNGSVNIGTKNVIFGAKYTTPGNSEFSISILSTTQFNIDRLGTSSRTFTVPTMSLGVWYHFAVCRDTSNNETIFLNGVRSSTGVVTDAITYTTTRYIGTWDSGGTGLSAFFGGNLAGLRVVIGSTVYDPNAATIVVPTQPLANVTNTVLLLNTPYSADYLTDTSASAFTFTNTDVTSSVAHP